MFGQEALRHATAFVVQEANSQEEVDCAMVCDV
jgi:hypothetical protein